MKDKAYVLWNEKTMHYKSRAIWPNKPDLEKMFHYAELFPTSLSAELYVKNNCAQWPFLKNMTVKEVGFTEGLQRIAAEREEALREIQDVLHDLNQTA